MTRSLCVEPRSEKEQRRDAGHLLEGLAPTGTHASKRMRTDDAFVPTATRQAAACGGAARDHERTYGVPTGGNSASDSHRRCVVSDHERHLDVGAVRRRITGKRRLPEVDPGALCTTATSDDQFMLRGHDAGGADKGLVGGTDPLPPCDILHRGYAGGGAEQLPFSCELRRRADISVGSTRSQECRSVQGIGMARFGAAEEGEMNTEKSTWSCSSISARLDNVLQSRAAVTCVDDRAGHAVARGAAAIRPSTVAATRGSPPEDAG